MKVLVLGVEGMLGHVVKIYFKEKGHTVFGTSRKGGDNFKLEVTENVDDIEKFINYSKPDAVVNCIGILNKVAEDNKALAVIINSYLPHYVDEVCRKNKIKFVHISTDCVFDGKKGSYTEDSLKDSTSFYGQSKALGEVTDTSSVTLRTSIVGPDPNQKGVGLFQWFMDQEGEAKGFDKAIWTGVTTVELARCIEESIEQDLKGLMHVVNNEKIDKYNLLKLFGKHFNKDITIVKTSDYIVDKSLVRTKGHNFNLPSYDQMIKDMSVWVASHENIYPERQRATR